MINRRSLFGVLAAFVGSLFGWSAPAKAAATKSKPLPMPWYIEPDSRFELGNVDVTSIPLVSPEGEVIGVRHVAITIWRIKG